MANIRIYQMNERGAKAAFLGYETALSVMGWEKLDSSVYEMVYEGEVDTTDPESIYSIFNGIKPEGYTGHSLSVSDVVDIDGSFFYCDVIGFREVDFTPAKMIRGFLLDVKNGTCGEHTVADELDTYYCLLNCESIEIVKCMVRGRAFHIICDEESLLKDEQIVSAVDALGSNMLIGNLFIVGEVDEEGELIGLSDDDVIYIQDNITVEATADRHHRAHPVLNNVWN